MHLYQFSCFYCTFIEKYSDKINIQLQKVNLCFSLMPIQLTEVPLVQVFVYPTSSVACDAGCDVHPGGLLAPEFFFFNFSTPCI